MGFLLQVQFLLFKRDSQFIRSSEISLVDRISYLRNNVSAMRKQSWNSFMVYFPNFECHSFIDLELSVFRVRIGVETREN